MSVERGKSRSGNDVPAELHALGNPDRAVSDVAPVAPERAEGIVDVFVDAFADYPVMRHVLGDRIGDADALRRLIGLFVSARVLRGEPLLGVRDGDRLVAAAIVSDPATPPPPDFLALRGEVWRELGAAAEARYAEYGAATRGFDPGTPHLHLNMIGVVRGAQRRGHARRLVDAVVALAEARPGCTGVSLTTEDPRNVPFYERLGFAVVGRGTVPGGFETWGFWRPTRNPPATSP